MIRRWLAGLAMVVVAAGAAGAREDGGDEQQLYFVYKEIVKPAMIGPYEEATRTLVQAMKDADVDPERVHFRTVFGPEIGYVYIVPIDGFAGMDDMRAAWGAAVEKIGQERWKSMAADTDVAVDHRESIHVMARPDLSHHPEKPRVPEDEVKFLSYAFYYAIPGKEEQLEGVAREFAAMYRDAGLNDAWSVYQAVTGNDLPVYIVIFGARSLSEYAERQEAIDASLGEKAEDLGLRAMACVRRVEKKEGWVRPDLSYPPGEAAPAAGHDQHR